MDFDLSITRTNYRVSDFLAWQRHSALDLRPPFQRGAVWSKKAKSFFIDSIVRGFPVPLLFLKDETDPDTYEPKRLVVDGQQRLRTVLAFLDRDALADANDDDVFTVLRSHNSDPAIFGRTFQQLPQSVRDRILEFQFSVHVLPPGTPNRVLLEIFARMNATGTQLNEQELRNAEWSGEFKQTAYNLSYDQLENWLDWGIFTRTQIARMKEAEMISELILLMIDGLKGKTQRAINEAYKKWDDGFPVAEAASRRCAQTFDRIAEVFSAELNDQYGHGLDKTSFSSQGWFFILFALVHDELFGSNITSPRDTRPRPVDAAGLRERLERKNLLLKAGDFDDELLKALRGAATDRSSRTTRYDFLAGD